MLNTMLPYLKNSQWRVYGEGGSGVLDPPRTSPKNKIIKRNSYIFAELALLTFTGKLKLLLMK
jgi:hypothetical protein